ncbi:MAG: DedA family protein [Pseudolysinimonas sp.]|uniref:DedA family protein n=1 Tax=Pseudolysinimonas sp. TaxID=2680009 RepID=UPI0032636CAF
MDETWFRTLADSPWLLPALFLLVVGDAFLVVLPSETVVVALAALSGATGSPSLAAIIPVAAAGAWVGDLLCFTIGRRVGLDRWRWQRLPIIQRAVARASATVRSRPAALIFTARYIPFARIAVNLSAGASGLSLRRFLPLAAVAGLSWAVYNCVVGVVFGTVFSATPLVAIVVSVLIAVTVGFVTDAVITRVARRSSPPEPDR